MELSIASPDVIRGGFMNARRTSTTSMAGAKYKNLATRLRAAREACGFSQEELARRSGVKRATIAKIESDKSAKPRGLEALAKELGVSPSWLLFGTSDDGEMPEDTISLAVSIQQLPADSRDHVKALVDMLSKKKK